MKLTNLTVEVSLCAECEGLELENTTNSDGLVVLDWREEDKLMNELVVPKLKGSTKSDLKLRGNNRLLVDRNGKCSHCHQNEGSRPCSWGLW